MDAELLALIAAKAFTLFLVLDPPGNVGPIASLLAPYDYPTQQRILRREVVIALIAMFLFYLGGSYFLAALDIQQSSVEITGGIVFGFVGIGILFARKTANEARINQPEPFIVPIAVPLIAGPSCLATLILFSHESANTFAILASIVLAWIAAAGFVLLAPFLAKVLGKNGLKVGEQIIGVICVFVALQMILKGMARFAAL
jgi:multiple antibiotic resistance protein